MNRFFFLLISALFVAIGAVAQPNSGWTYASHRFENERLMVQTNKGRLIVQPFTDHVVRLSFLPTGVDSLRPSDAVVRQAGIVSFSLDEQPKYIALGTEHYQVRITKNPFAVQLMRRNEVALADLRLVDERGFRGFSFAYPNTEVLMGTGERALPMDRRGHRLELYNKPDYGYGIGAQNLNFGLPYVFSPRGFGVLFDNGSKGYFDFGKVRPDRWEVGFVAGEQTLYLIAADSPAAVLEKYTDLTGRQPMPPRWAFGNLVSRMAYQNQREVQQVASRMREARFPMDAVILDLNWFGKFGSGPSGMGNLDWDRDNWPQAEDLVADLRQQGIRTVLITEPYFLDSTQHFSHLANQNLLATDTLGRPYALSKFYFGRGGLLDVFKPEARTWFWSQYRKHIDAGIEGWWGDLGEPEHHPEDMMHSTGMADHVHNLYGHYWLRAVAEGYAQDYADRRVFHLARSGFAGSQRYGVLPWSGDVGRSWRGLQAQPTITLAMGMSGFAYMHSDLGGFALGDKDPELYTRWMQMGVFAPIYRPHGSTHPSEPIFWDETVQERVRNAIRLRYAMLPYNYSLAWENARTGAPLARPLWFEKPTETALYAIHDTYLWGSSLLVAPVLEAGATVRRVYLPTGLWYDFDTEQSYTGGQWIDKPVDANSIPMFARGGSFLPMALDEGLHTEQYNLQKLRVHFFPSGQAGQQTSYTLYHDDGLLSQAFERGKYALMLFEATENTGLLQLSVDKNGPDFELMPDQHFVELVLHGQSTAPTEVRINQQALPVSKSAKRFEGVYYGSFYRADRQELVLRFIYMGVNKYDIHILK